MGQGKDKKGEGDLWERACEETPGDPLPTVINLEIENSFLLPAT